MLDLYACFLIPVYTLLFAGRERWFATNFSVRAVLGEDYYHGFVLWGLLAGAYFFVLLTRLALTVPEPGLRLGLRLLTLAACLALAYAIAIPYLPKFLPRWAELHVILAAGACVLLMAALLALILRLRREDKARYQPLLWAWLGIVLVCAVLFWLAGIVSSALEVFFTISATLLARRLWLLRLGRLPRAGGE